MGLLNTIDAPAFYLTSTSPAQAGSQYGKQVFQAEGAVTADEAVFLKVNIPSAFINVSNFRT